MILVTVFDPSLRRILAGALRAFYGRSVSTLDRDGEDGVQLEVYPRNTDETEVTYFIGGALAALRVSKGQ